MKNKSKRTANERFVDVMSPQGIGYRVHSKNDFDHRSEPRGETVIGIRLGRGWPMTGRGLAVLTFLTREGRNRQLKLEMENRQLEALGLSFAYAGEVILPYNVNLMVRSHQELIADFFREVEGIVNRPFYPTDLNAIKEFRKKCRSLLQLSEEMNAVQGWDDRVLQTSLHRLKEISS